MFFLVHSQFTWWWWLLGGGFWVLGGGWWWLLGGGVICSDCKVMASGAMIQSQQGCRGTLYNVYVRSRVRDKPGSLTSAPAEPARRNSEHARVIVSILTNLNIYRDLKLEPLDI